MIISRKTTTFPNAFHEDRVETEGYYITFNSGTDGNKCTISSKTSSLARAFTHKRLDLVQLYFRTAVSRLGGGKEWK